MRTLTVLLVAAPLLLGSFACNDVTQPMNQRDTTTTPPPPPPPQPFDLRFKGVGVLSSNTDLVHENVFASSGSALQFHKDSVAGSPLTLGSGLCSATECDWFFDAFAQPSTVARVDITYRPTILSEFPSYLDTALTDTVMTSLDLEPAVGVVAAAQMVTTAEGGYRLHQGLVTTAGLPAAAAQEGLAHRVITAVSFDSGQVLFVAYSWQHDTTTLYDTQVAPATYATADSVAQSLAGNGYVLTAFGGDSADGFLFVGTRAQGATTARTLQIGQPGGIIFDLTGYAPVAYLTQTTAGGAALKLIFER